MELELHGLFEHNKTFDYGDYEYKEEGCPSSTVTDSMAVLIPLLYSVGLVWGLLGNGMVLVILWQKRRNLSVMDIFIFHLGIADCLLLLTLPLWAVDAVKGWIIGTGFCKLTGAVFKINFYCGIFLLALISLDCYLSIVRRMQLYSRKKPMVIHGCCVIVWFFCLLLSIPDWLYLKVISDETDHAKMECNHSYTFDSCRLASRLLHLVVGFTLPALVLLFCCSCILLKLRHTSSGLQKKKDRRTHVLVALVVAFFISWMPYNIVLIKDTAQPVNNVSITGAERCEGRQWTASNATAILGLLHCVVSPVIYLFLSKEFRRRALAMVKFSGCETDSSDFSLWDSAGLNDSTYVQQEEQGSLQPMNDIIQTINNQDQYR
ncbi:C-X-C chemokine receptor type 3.3 [Myxocyprinus asiaticus]|uniref:C-X-C chemokine receptor type 3.3 n=1 Tax=Myxocyprinus asiaticus TaxID=70543 RepID=UPI0022223F38|nr:C-X-C chemokine receptor type 3.3 [Myxocyprinus asiaticus]XP_051575003.1 C-X-C chemokine receptor type 3.3 [Myxocyprinus asiaticus]